MTLRHFHNKQTGENYWFDLDTGEIDGRAGEYHQPPHIERQQSALPCPMIMERAADKNPYRSPIDGKPVMNHYQRKEDLKRSGCREVETSEWTPQYNNERFAKKNNLRYTPKIDTRKRIATGTPPDD